MQVGKGQPPEGDLFARVEDVAPPLEEKKQEHQVGGGQDGVAPDVILVERMKDGESSAAQA